MKIGFSELLKENIEISADRFIAELENHLNNKNQMFQGRPLSGRINGTTYEFKINPPFIWADPFKSKVQGKIFPHDKLNQLKCKVSPNMTIKIFFGAIFFLLLLKVEQFDLLNFDKSFKIVFSLFLLLVILIVFVKIKVKWDANQFKNLLEEIIVSTKSIS